MNCLKKYFAVIFSLLTLSNVSSNALFDSKLSNNLSNNLKKFLPFGITALGSALITGITVSSIFYFSRNNNKANDKLDNKLNEKSNNKLNNKPSNNLNDELNSDTNNDLDYKSSNNLNNEDDELDSETNNELDDEEYRLNSELLEALLSGRNWCDSERARNTLSYFLNERCFDVRYIDTIYLFASCLSKNCDIPNIPKDKYIEKYGKDKILIINIENVEEIEHDIELMLDWWSKIAKNNDSNDMSKKDIEMLSHLFKNFKKLKNEFEC